MPQGLCLPTPVATQHPLLLSRGEGSCLVGSSQLPACSTGLVVVGVLRGEFVLPSKRPSSEQSPGHLETVGGIKTWPSALRPLLVVVSFYSDELEKFMESQGAANPGILILTTSLSKPFLRLDKYVTLLQELERHMEVGGVWGCWAVSAP